MPGVYDQFQLYCPIPYFFTDKIDDARKVRSMRAAWEGLSAGILLKQLVNGIVWGICMWPH